MLIGGGGGGGTGNTSPPPPQYTQTLYMAPHEIIIMIISLNRHEFRAYALPKENSFIQGRRQGGSICGNFALIFGQFTSMT